MKRTKTTGEWIQTLPPDIREQALVQIKKVWEDPADPGRLQWKLEQRAKTLHEALECAFVWARTPQGHHYWSIVADKGRAPNWWERLKARWGCV